MAKRRSNAIESDGEAEQQEAQAGSSKRARFNEQANERITYAAQAGESSKSKKKRAKKGGDADGIDDEDAEPVTLDDLHESQQAEDDLTTTDRFEQEHEEAIRQSIRNREHLSGGIAQFGIIESVEMHQFMCHKFLSFKFGPQINFIIGHNGSGKSACLSAITVALGGKSSSTGRANGLKSFIREGQSVSEVTLVLKNQGDEAYDHDTYGDSIVITRRFTKDGGSSYKIKSRDGRVISTKRDELSKICDHMNIQVDNPMNILTQDAARQFLSASSPNDKYKFFLRGTQLSQLSEEYELIMENISSMSKVLTAKKLALPDLEERFKEATARFDEASKAREQKQRADELKKELAWAHVAVKEDELRQRVSEHTKLEARLPRVETALANAEQKLQETTEAVRAKEEIHAGLGNVTHLHDRRAEIGVQIREKTKKLSENLNDQKNLQADHRRVKRQIEELTHRIETENQKTAANSQAKQDDIQTRLNAAKDEYRLAESRLRDLETQGKDLEATVAQLRAVPQQTSYEINQAKSRLDECQQQIQRCMEQQKNALAPYGKDINRVLQEVERQSWHGEVVGPLGKYVTVKDMKWAPLLRTQIGGMMSSFALTDGRDRPQLSALLKRYGNPQISIIVAKRDLFDYSMGEPPSQYTTILRAIDVSDPYVLRLMINSNRIEKLILAETRKIADDILSQIHGGGVAFTGDFYRVSRAHDGGGSTPFNGLNMRDPRNLLWTGKDPAAQLHDWKRKYQETVEEIQRLEMKYNEDDQGYRDAQRRLNDLRTQAKKAYRIKDEAKNRRDGLQVELNDCMPAENAGLEEARRDMEKEIEVILDQFRVLAEQKEQIDDELKPLNAETRALKDQISAFDGRAQEANNAVMVAVEDRVQAQANQKHWVAKLKEEREKIEAALGRVNLVQQEFENWTEKAEQFCARVENPRGVTEVERDLNAVQKALKEREKKHGASVEEMTIEVNRTHAAWDNAKKEYMQVVRLNRALKASLKIRLDKWYDFRRHIAFRCKVVFQYHLSNRGYYGKVMFNHTDQTLQLKVRTEEQHIGTQQGNRDKDPRSLSGGEKSFATICLLLAMWESIGSPIRCLDEFDVFMDAVNRRISMKMMIDTANSSEGKQYILITPQNMQNIHVGPSVRVLRMEDPERGQGTLAYGQSAHN